MHKTVLDEGPDEVVVTLDQAKAHLNFSGSSKDDYITSLIKASTNAVELYLNRALITQTWKVYYNCWSEKMLIPFPPLQSVESVKFFDTNGDEQTLSEDDYYWVVKNEDPGFIQRKYNASYPVLDYVRPDAIEIAFTAGYGDDADSVPEQIKIGILLMLTKYFENRSDVVIGPAQVSVIPGHIADMIHPFKIYQF